MKFLALALMLVLEQVRPLRERGRIDGLLHDYAALIERYANAGGYRHGLLAWVVCVGSVAIVTALIAHVLSEVSAILGLAFSIGVLYVTMGFRAFIDRFNEVQQLLRTGDLAAAREALARWRGREVADVDADGIARAAIEHGLLASHRSAFGIVAWFVVFGPAGAVVYRMAAVLEGIWGRRADAEAATFGQFAAQAFSWVDWIPARLTASALAAVGNFEDAVYCWRMQADRWSPGTDGIILASGAGALGVRLGGTADTRDAEPGPALGTGEAADLDDMQDTAGLVWKALCLWLFVILLMSVAHALG